MQNSTEECFTKCGREISDSWTRGETGAKWLGYPWCKEYHKLKTLSNHVLWVWNVAGGHLFTAIGGSYLTRSWFFSGFMPVASWIIHARCSLACRFFWSSQSNHGSLNDVVVPVWNASNDDYLVFFTRHGKNCSNQSKCSRIWISQCILEHMEQCFYSIWFSSRKSWIPLDFCSTY